MSPAIRIESRILDSEPPIAIAVAGQGEVVVVFLHGLGSTRESWYSQLEYFGRSCLALAWDAPGYGASGEYAGDFDFAIDFSRDLAGVLDRVGAAQAHLVGLSMGGMIAQCFYFTYPTRVASLVLADTFPSFAALGEDVVRGFLATRVEPLLRGASPADLAPGAVSALLAPGAAPAVRQLLLESLSAVRVDSYVKTARAMAAQDALGALDAIGVPTLVVSGELDRLVPLSLARDMAAKIPGARLAVIPGAGHLPNIERPDLFNEAVFGFLCRLLP